MSLVPQCSLPNFAIDQGLEYYAGKSKLLDWVNRLLDLNLQRLEQLTSGAVYCQILDAFYADVVAIRKVNFLAREEYEILPNYKILQAAFNALGFTKELDVAKLSRASTSDLMEFTQWLYKNFNGVITVPNYNPAARRQMSLKGSTSNIPFPACVVNGSFEFGRSDLRTSGTWAVGTPAEPTKLAPRSLRSNSNTPGTNGKSASKRNTPYVNVASRYREGLAVPPEHFDRRSPRLSPGSGGTPRRVHVSHGGTQTDFEDEEYRPMTAADVGTEAVPARPAQYDFGRQPEDGFGYDLDLSRSGSVASASAASMTSPGPAPDPSAFGSGAFPSSGLDSIPEPSAELSPVPEDGPTTAAAASPQATAEGDGSAAAGGVPNGLANSYEEDEVDAAAVRTSVPSVGEGPSASGSSTPRDGLDVQPDGEAGEAEPALYTVFGAEAGSAAAASAAEGTDGPGEPAGEGLASRAATQGGESAASISLAGSAGGNGPATSAEAAPQLSGASSVSLSHPGGALSSTQDSTPQASARDQVASPAAASSASVSAAATPSPRTAPWRSSGTALPPEVASLLASPAARTRVASAACLRDMAAAIDASTAALQAFGKSIDSYTTLLAGIPSPAPSADAAGAAADATAGSGSSCSPALCGKARSLQDALVTLLAHTTLLLSDVKSYSESTHPAPLDATPSGGGAPSSSEAGAAPSPRGAEDAGAEGAKPPRNFAAEAVALLNVARAQEGRLQGLVQQAKESLQMPQSAADYRASSSSVAGPSGASGPAASSGSKGAPSVNRHLTDEQRKLCSTALLDGHLKAVGMAQFALVQDIHKELAAVASTYFRHTGITQGGEGSMGGGEGSTGGVGSQGGVSTSSTRNRKARVFKLGEYQLKQLRNGDIYKGRYVCNKKNGEGVYHFINADVYEGEFRDDRMDGYGVYTFSHEGRYEGQWRNAVYNGTGAETFAKGSTYHGEYAGGLRNGWGVCRFYNGDYYEGRWAKGLRDGSGMQQCTDDSNFVGDYQRGKRHGHGVYSFPNGDRYEGQYSEDLPHGHGTYHFASGQCYQGQWQHGKKHGWSVYTVDNGSRFMGLWSEGKPTWVQPLSGDNTTTTTEESGRALQQAMGARDLAIQAATEARKRAAAHWEVDGPVQTRLLTALSQAHSSSGCAQQARRKACDLAARLDSAVALLQIQGAGAPVPSTTP